MASLLEEIEQARAEVGHILTGETVLPKSAKNKTARPGLASKDDVASVKQDVAGLKTELATLAASVDTMAHTLTVKAATEPDSGAPDNVRRADDEVNELKSAVVALVLELQKLRAAEKAKWDSNATIQYDALGRINMIRYADGRVGRIVYDGQNRVAQIVRSRK